MPGLKDRLLARIAAEGPIPFEVFQHHALYDPDGFFGGQVLRSHKAGDFLTSPEVSPLFGETLAVFVRQELTRVNGTRVVEVAAGSGSLLRPLLSALNGSPRLRGDGPHERSEWEGGGGRGAAGGSDDGSPGVEAGLAPSDGSPRLRGDGPHERSEWEGGTTDSHNPPSGGMGPAATGGGRGATDVSDGSPRLRGDGPHERSEWEGGVEPWAVEGSPAAREALAELIDPAHVVDSLDGLPDPIGGVVLANELLDNLPVALAIRTGDDWTERWVGAQGGELVLVPVPARQEVADWADRFGLPCVDGGIVEVQLAAEAWVRRALGRLGTGTLVLIDYGETAENLAPRRQDGTLRTYRSHHLGPHPLAEPGETDITVDVNVTAMVAAAESAGATVEAWRQDDFLGEFGLRERLSQLRHEELALARDGDPMERLKVRSIRSEAETLLHPRGLGDFRVVVARL